MYTVVTMEMISTNNICNKNYCCYFQYNYYRYYLLKKVDNNAVLLP